MDSNQGETRFDASNTLPILILASYLSLAAALTVSIINSIVARHAQTTRSKPKSVNRQSEIKLFSVLAAGSLSMTWFYMFSFFAQSYSDWALLQSARKFEGVSGVGNVDLGSWLRDSKLFKEAWSIAMANQARWWWTQQIFSWTTLWSFWTGIEGYRYKIPSPYKFMLLGQLVAISFATNLFFLAMLVSPSASRSSTSTSNHRFETSKDESNDEPRDQVSANLSKRQDDFQGMNLGKESQAKKGSNDSLITLYCVQFLILPGLGSAAVLPAYLNTPSFMPTLLIPHLLLFVPPALAYFAPSSKFCKTAIESIDREKNKLFSTIIVAGVISLGWSTYSAVFETGGSGWRDIKGALYSHPAVSSVGWDVICCWLSWGIWTGSGPDLDS